MASSISPSFGSVHGLGAFNQLNDSVFELYKPATGKFDLEMVFFHGFQSQDCENAFVKTWMVADESACWLSSWLPGKFPRARILAVSYDSSTFVTHSKGRMEMYLVGENLARCIIELAGVGRTCPVVLVGHCVGGLVLKEVCCGAERVGTRLKAQGPGVNSYDIFLSNMRGVFFYSTSQMGSRIQGTSKLQGPLLKYYELLSSDRARLNDKFSKLRSDYRWKTSGVSEANETEHGKSVIPMTNYISAMFRRRHSLVVEEGSARYDLDEFCVIEGEDSTTICKPKDQRSSSFQLLVKFVQCILDDEEALTRWRITLQFPLVFKSRPDCVKQVVEMLQLDKPEPSQVSLVGMGGIGKSTVAKEVLVEIATQFDFVCFVEDVKSRLQKRNLPTLVASELRYGNGLRPVRVPNDDAESLWRVLRGKKVLLIMDNVDSAEQIDSLMRSDWVRKGSRLIITSRERPHGLMHSFVMYEVPFLSRTESKNLFLTHLDVDAIREIPSELIDHVVAKCDGLPLTLEVTGSSLQCETNLAIWYETLESLRKAESVDGSADDRLWEKLRASFDQLAGRERKMFLDLAVFDNCEGNGLKYDLHVWKAVWSSGWSAGSASMGLRNLENKCFIRIKSKYFPSNNTKLRHFASLENPTFVYIHEQLRDMGRSISRPSDERIELCRGVWQADDVDYLLTANEGEDYQTEVLSVALDQFTTSRHFRKRYPWGSIGRLQRLRLLKMSNVSLIGTGPQRFPPNIAFLHMKRCVRAKAHGYLTLQENDCWPIRAEDVGGLHRMTVLILEKFSCKRLPENFHRLQNLRILVVNGQEFGELPKNFGLLPSLQVLYLERVGFSKLPGSFYQLSSLQSLMLISCAALQSLCDWSVPGALYSEGKGYRPLSMLERITLQDLPALKSLSETFGQLGCLKELFIDRCPSLTTLPESFGQLGSLQRLMISACSGLSMLPESFGQLCSLEELDIGRKCDALSVLPEGLGLLDCLKRFHVSQCSNLCALPESFGQLESLQEVYITDCGALSALPDSFGQLGSLQEFQISECDVLSSLPKSFGQLGSLKELHIHKCGALSALPESFGQLSSLQILSICSCSALSALPESFGQLNSLEELHISQCDFVSALPESFGELGSLEDLHISQCDVLSALPESFGQLGLLEKLHISECRALSTLPESFGHLSFLENLDILKCNALSTLPQSFGQLGSIQTLFIWKCSALSGLPESFGQAGSLQSLHISGCDALSALPESFGHLGSLKELKISECDALSGLPESFGQLGSLQKLVIWKCSGLSTLPESFGQLRFLERLFIWECSSVSALPESFGHLGSLQRLGVWKCSTLSALPESFGQLSSLERLFIWECPALLALPENFGQLSSLQRLGIWRCSALSALPESFGRLVSLERLSISECSALSTTLPENLRQLPSIGELDM